MLEGSTKFNQKSIRYDRIASVGYVGKEMKW